jgi:isoleucyl-tRNA synthetase
VHHIQQLRKDRGLDVSDRITLYVDGAPELQQVLAAHRDYIMAETLSTSIQTNAAGLAGVKDVKLDGIVARVAVERVT